MRNSTFPVILLASFILCSSCIKQPTAMFSYEPAINPEAGELIKFKNESLDANEYLWDFGNGQTSEEETPSMRFKPPGNYEITLTASNAFRTSIFSDIILIQPPTILDLWIYDPDGKPLAYGDVDIFANYDDAYYGRNILYSGTTDLQGHASFNNLDAQMYYVVFFLGKQTGAYFSGGNLGPLLQNQINEYVGIAEFYPDAARKKALSSGQMMLHRK